MVQAGVVNLDLTELACRYEKLIYSVNINISGLICAQFVLFVSLHPGYMCHTVF